MFKLVGKLVKGLFVFIGASVFLVCCVAAIATSGNDVETANNEVKPEEVVQVEEQDTQDEQVKEEKQVEEVKEQLTISQKNAVKQAENYLNYTSFSRVGLIKQLEFEGYSNEDATYAVDYVTVDWNEQCAKKAQSYLDYTAFSRDGLHDQLSFEGFTEEQIQYGLQAVGY